MPTRADQKTATRDRLLGEAKRLFIEQGYEQTTTRQLAQASGVSVGTVFAHFADKSALLRAILHEDIEAALATAREEIAADTDAIGAMTIYSRHLYREYAAHPALSRALIATGLFDLRPFRAQLGDFMNELAARVLRQHRCTPEQAEVLVGNLMANYFLVLVQGLSATRDDSAEPEHWCDQLARLNAPLKALDIGTLPH